MQHHILSTMVCELRRQLLGRFYGRDPAGLMVNIEIGMSDYGYLKDGNTKKYTEANERKTLCFIFSGDTNVFTYVTDEIFYRDVPPLEEMEHRSSHDSCWSSDGVESFIWKQVCQMYERVSRHRPKTERPAMKNYDIMLWNISFKTGIIEVDYNKENDGRLIVKSFIPDENIVHRTR